MKYRCDALLFDAYGTLFDVFSVAGLAEKLLPGHGGTLTQRWRAKQLEYTWLGSLMQRRHDFGEVTAQALDYAIASLALAVPAPTRQQLIDAWLALTPFADALPTLVRLAPRPRWILSNGTRAMLDPLVERSGLKRELEGVISVDEAGVYKPHPDVYRLASERLALPPARIGFVSANGWDAIGAKAFGFTTWWINRGGTPTDRHGPAPDSIVGTLGDLVNEIAT